MLRTLRILLVVGVLLMTLGAVGAQDSNTLILARAADTTGLDPHTQTAFASIRLLELIYEPLVQVDSQLNIVPALAESWAFNEDATVLTLNLRQGVTFHDGTTFEASDVVATLERILNEETGAAARANYLSIASIDTPDDYTVVLNLSQPDVPLLAALATVNAGIAPSELIASNGFSEATIGTGPFILSEWIPEEITRLLANNNWWGEGPFVDGIDMRVIPDEASILAALRAGEIDFALLNDPLVATLLIGDDRVQLNAVPALAYHVLQLNPAREPMDVLEVRQAMSCAIDRQEVLDTASLGEGTVTGPLTIPAYAVPLEDYFCYTKDLARAQELMAASGVEPFTITVIAASAEPPTALSEAQSIQAQLAEIGITVEIEPLELSVYVDRWLKGDFDAAIALNGGRVDPYPMYARYWTKTGNLQIVANYIDDTLDALMQQGRAEPDPAARYEIFAEFQKHLVEMAPWIWLYNGYEYTAQQPYVSGFQPNPTDSLYSLAWTRLDR
ncbi:MAG TPA: ABC transporter substrate-binding protein [Aggregatilineales bacterium]|nr:ABC transporter substrate-binding protein [Aggregatilineales bacterium]